MSKILFTIGGEGSSSRLNYLPTFELVQGISMIGKEVHLVVTDRTPIPKTNADSDSAVWLRIVPHDYRTSIGFSRNMNAYLRKNADYDIYHTNGLCTYLNHLTCVTARRNNRPYLITPYGMMNDYRPGISIASRLYHRVFFSHDIRGASCLRALDHAEAMRFRKMGLENPIAIIPWPIGVPDFLENAVAIGTKWKEEHPQNRRIGCFIVDYALQPMETVIDAFQKVAEPETELILIDFGYVDRKDTEKIKNLVRQRNIHNVRVSERDNDFNNTVILASCCATVIPSHHQFLGHAVARSLLCHTPVICVHEAGWIDMPYMNCGWWCSSDKASLEKFISIAMLSDLDVLKQKGIAGHKLVLENYGQKVIASKMIRVYDWLMGLAPKPPYVI